MNNQNASCTHCGIIFVKFAQHQQRQQAFELEQWAREDRQKKLWLMLGGAGLVVGLVLSLIIFSSNTSPETPPTQTTQARTLEYYPWERGTTPGYWERDGTQFRWVPTPGQPMLAELQTRFVRINNIYSLGFVATDDCHVIFSGDLSTKPDSELGEKKANLQQHYYQLQTELDEAKQRFDEKRIEFVNTCKVCEESKMRGKLQTYIAKVEKLERELAATGQKLHATDEWIEQDQKLSVYTDNSVASARIIQTSKKFPLSLLLLDKPSCKNLQIGYPDELMQDDRVFTISGAPKYELYGGKYTGRSQKPDPSDYLLYDIDIPQVDQGTPLFDKEGNVLGIITTPYNGKERAIPIDVALRDLGLLL